MRERRRRQDEPTTIARRFHGSNFTELLIMKKHRKQLQRWCARAAVFALVLATTGILANEPKTSRSFHRVLFLGNSITSHSPKKDIGWSGNWGMAATAKNKDFVHRVADALSKEAGKPCETMINNIAGFERDYANYNLKPMLEEALKFDADLIILAIGENVAKLDSDEASAKFTDSTRQLLKSLQTDDADSPVVVVRSCFWANEAKDQALRQVCEEVGGIFVNIGNLGADESNYARSEREISHKGVAAHPGDKGMKAIADAILEALK